MLDSGPLELSEISSENSELGFEERGQNDPKLGRRVWVQEVGQGGKSKKKKITKKIFKKVRIKKINFRYSTIKQYINVK